MKKGKKPRMDGGRAFRLRMKPFSMEECPNGATCLLPNRIVINSEHNDRPKQTKKRRVKLKWLIRNIPRGGARALEIVKDRMK